MRVGAPVDRGGGSCALGVDRRRRVAYGARGGWVWPGSRGERIGGVGTLVGRSYGEATREDGHARLVVEVHVVPAGSSESRA